MPIDAHRGLPARFGPGGRQPADAAFTDGFEQDSLADYTIVQGEYAIRSDRPFDGQRYLDSGTADPEFSFYNTLRLDARTFSPPGRLAAVCEGHDATQNEDYRLGFADAATGRKYEFVYAPSDTDNAGHHAIGVYAPEAAWGSSFETTVAEARDGTIPRSGYTHVAAEIAADWTLRLDVGRGQHTLTGSLPAREAELHPVLNHFGQVRTDNLVVTRPGGGGGGGAGDGGADGAPPTTGESGLLAGSSTLLLGLGALALLALLALGGADRERHRRQPTR